MGSSKPQQPEQRRSEHTPVTKQDHAAEVLQGTDQPGNRGGMGPVPEDNQPGQRPQHDQDKPDPEKFRRRLSGQRASADQDGETGTEDSAGSGEAAGGAQRQR